jgi:hypothetical protein
MLLAKENTAWTSGLVSSLFVSAEKIRRLLCRAFDVLMKGVYFLSGTIAGQM